MSNQKNIIVNQELILNDTIQVETEKVQCKIDKKNIFYLTTKQSRIIAVESRKGGKFMKNIGNTMTNI